MSHKISWTHKCDDGVKREVRVDITHGGMKWQFKRKDQERWDYDSTPTSDDWDKLEEILERRTGRGRAINLLETVRKLRSKAGV